MSFFQQLFSRAPKSQSVTPIVQFGRFSDADKDWKNTEEWDKAMDAYSKGMYIKSYVHVLEYLSDPRIKNVEIQVRDEKIQFHFLQGSKIIRGMANEDGFYAEAKIAKAKELDIALTRTLLEENYNLKYTRYALDSEDNITIIFQTSHLDASPYKLYYGLEELSLRADHKDDLIIQSFENLSPINTEHTQLEDEHVVQVKFDFYKRALHKTLDLIVNGSLSPDKYPGAISYLILDTAYKIDFLVNPQGVVMKWIEDINHHYFAQPELTPEKKNIAMTRILQKMAAMPIEDFRKELYRTTKTFGATKPGNHNRLVEVIDREFPNIQWYASSGYIPYAQSITGFIVGNVLYTYALPKLDRELLQVYYEVVEHQFITGLGFDPLVGEDGKIIASKVRRRISEIKDKYKGEYTRVEFNEKTVQVDNTLVFSITFLDMIRAANFQK